MSFFSKLFKKEAEDWLYGQLADAQTPGDSPVRAIKKDEEYVSIVLKSMRIVNVRVGFSKFYTTVHSFISLPHASGTRANFYVSTTPGQLEEMDKEHIDRVITMNKRLLGPTPYLGGDLNLELGLFSIKSADLLKPYISLLNDMSNLAGVSVIKIAEPYIEPLEKGINLLLGGANPISLETGISTTYNGKLETGYYIVMRAPKDVTNKNDFKIDKNDSKLLDASGEPVKEYPYMVFQVTADTKRDDWRELPDIKLTHDALKTEAKSGKIEAAREAWGAFKRAVQFTDDMIETDKDAIIKQVKDDLDKKLGASLQAAGEVIELRDLKEIEIYSR